MTITAYTDLRSPYTFVAKAEVYRWEEDFGVAVDWWPYTTPLEEAFGPAEGRDERQLRKIRYSYMNVRRLGAAQGLTIRGTKRIFDPTPAHVGLLQARDDGVFRAFHDLAFERVFRRELDPDDPATSARRSPRRAATATPGPGAFATAPRSWKRSIAAPRRRGSSGSRASSSTASSSGEGIRWRRSGNGLPNASSDARSAVVHTAPRGTALGNHGGRGVSPHADRARAALASTAGGVFHLTPTAPGAALASTAGGAFHLTPAAPSPHAGAGAGSTRCSRSAARLP